MVFVSQMSHCLVSFVEELIILSVRLTLLLTYII